VIKQAVVDTADLGPEGLSLSGVYPPGVLDLGRDAVRQIGDVRWSCSLARQGARIRVTGALDGVLELPCDRCLEASEIGVSGDFDLFFEQRDSLEYEENAEIELEEPDMRTAFMSGSEIGLGDIVAEQLLLSIPMKPLCRDDCRGLCAQCGQNLNSDTCDCAAPVVNPAFSGLRALKERLENNSWK